MSHQKSCTPDNPMVKQKQENSYSSRAGAKVSYPKLKTKLKENSEPENNNNDESIKPTRQDLVTMIQNDDALSEVTVRSELMEIIKSFLNKNKPK